jgi:hypothetical protein
MLSTTSGWSRGEPRIRHARFSTLSGAALRLDDVERAHLLTLAGPVRERRRTAPAAGAARPKLVGMLDLIRAPAMVTPGSG